MPRRPGGPTAAGHQHPLRALHQHLRHTRSRLRVPLLFFVRKFHFLYNAKALVFFPGGFRTIDEMMEPLTLMQTQKVRKRMGVVLYGRGYWESAINFDAVVRHGVISAEDRDLFVAVESVDEAFIRICSFLEENYGGTLLEVD